MREGLNGYRHSSFFLRATLALAAAATVGGVHGHAWGGALEPEALARAKQAYESAAQFAKAHPDDPKEASARFEQVMRDWPQAPEGELARARLGEIEKAVKEHAEEELRQREARLNEEAAQSAFWGDILPLLMRRDYVGAQTAGNRLPRSTEGRKARLDELKEIVRGCKAFWPLLVSEAAQLEFQPVRYKGIMWQSVGVKDDFLLLRSGHAEVFVDLLHVPVKEAVTYMRMETLAGFPKDALCCLYAFDAEWESAREQAGVSGGEKRQKLLALIGVWRELYVDTLLERAATAKSAGRLAEARENAATLLKRYSDAEAVKENRTLLESCIPVPEPEPPEPAPEAVEPRPRPQAIECRRCYGTGVIWRRVWRDNWLIREGYLVKQTCPTCGGTGRLNPDGATPSPRGLPNLGLPPFVLPPPRLK